MNATPLDHAIGSTTIAAALAAWKRSLVRLWRAHRHRREVAQLRRIDDHLLADIGLTRQDVEAALSVPLGQDPSHRLIRARNERRPGAACVQRSIGLSRMRPGMSPGRHD